MIDIIIPVFNHKEYLSTCLYYLRKSTSDYRLIIIDAGSDSETKEYLKGISDGLVIFSDKKLSFAQACNIGISKSNTEFIALLNTDVIVSRNWLDRLHRYLYSSDKIALVSAISNLQQSICGYYGYGIHKIDDVRDIDSIYDYMSIKRKFLIENVDRVECYACLGRRELINFDEDYNNGFEDYDLCSRLIENGYHICLAPDVLVFHFGAISRGIESINKNESIYERKRVYIPAVIPIKLGHFIHPDVVASLSNQTRKLSIYPIMTPRDQRDEDNDLCSGYFSQAAARNFGKSIVLNELNGDFIYFQDCSVVLCEKDAIENAINYMKQDTKLGVVYFNVHPYFDGELEHFSAASMIMRSDVARKLDFVAISSTICFCKAFADSVRSHGWTIRYYKEDPVGFEVKKYGRKLLYDIPCIPR